MRVRKSGTNVSQAESQSAGWDCPGRRLHRPQQMIRSENEVQRNAAFWEGVIDENGLEIGNEARPSHHWTREDQEAKLVIDLTLATRPIGKWTMLSDDCATGSEQEVIAWEVEVHTMGEADHEREVRWNFVAMTKNDVEAGEKLWMEKAKQRAQLDVECTEDEMEKEATWCQEAMNSDLDTTPKRIMTWARSKSWWNANMKERRRMVRRERRR